jgi:predicted secreted protein
MSIGTGIVFYMVIWAVTFLLMNPLWQTSQGESGTVIPGTPESAPVDAMVVKKALWTTLWATLAFGALYYVIEWDVVTLDDLLWATPPSERPGGMNY